MANAQRRLGLRHLAPGALRRRGDIRLIDAGELASIQGLMDHSLTMALEVYALPEAQQLRTAASALRRGATQPRDTGATQKMGKAR